MADSYRNEVYATSSHNTKALRADKDALRAQGYPLAGVEKLVDTYLHLDRFTHLAGKDIVFLPAPSTSRTNILPRAFAARLRGAYGGEIIADWANCLNVTKAANKGGLTKLRDPVRVDPGPKFHTLSPDRNYILVDDVVTTGQTTDALRELLRTRGIEVAGVVSLGQAELRVATARDLERITEKLGEPSLSSEVEAAFAGKLKHYANYIERELRPGTREEVRGHLVHTARLHSAAHAVYSGAKGILRMGHPVDSRLQLGQATQTGLFRRNPASADQLPRNSDERVVSAREAGRDNASDHLASPVREQVGGSATTVVQFGGRAFVVTVDKLKDRPGALPTFRLSDARTREPAMRISAEMMPNAPATGCIHVKNSQDCEGLADALARSGAFERKRELIGETVIEMRVVDPVLQAHLEQYERIRAGARARQVERMKSRPQEGLRPRLS